MDAEHGLAGSALIGIFAGAVIGISTVALGLPMSGQYGFALFLGV